MDEVREKKNVKLNEEPKREKKRSLLKNRRGRIKNVTLVRA